MTNRVRAGPGRSRIFLFDTRNEERVDGTAHLGVAAGIPRPGIPRLPSSP